MLKFLFVATLLFSSLLFAQSQPHKTVADLAGSDWREFSEAVRDGYVAGYLSAMFQAEALATVCEATAVATKVTADSPAADLAKICVHERNEFRFAEVAGVAQYREGMNAFYKDFRNLQVPLSKAIELVRDQIGGRAAEDIEKELVEWRQCHADSSKCSTLVTPTKAPAEKRQ
jgi:hypothetical protein